MATKRINKFIIIIFIITATLLLTYIYKIKLKEREMYDMTMEEARCIWMEIINHNSVEEKKCKSISDLHMRGMPFTDPWKHLFKYDSTREVVYSAGYDGIYDNEDDIVYSYNKYASNTAIIGCKAIANLLKDPQTRDKAIEEIIQNKFGDNCDGWHNPYGIDTNENIVYSKGPDGIYGTPDDIFLKYK